MLTAAFLRSKHGAGLPWDAYLATDPSRAGAWRTHAQALVLAPAQRELLAGFTRRCPMICLSGMWCGDCAAQCPVLHAIAQACPATELVFLDRDGHKDLADQVRIAGGNRVPTVLWMTEEFEFVHLLGDRTLSRCRSAGRSQLGPACALPTAQAASDERAALVAEWIAECERVQWILRLSPRLRQLHGD